MRGCLNKIVLSITSLIIIFIVGVNAVLLDYILENYTIEAINCWPSICFFFPEVNEMKREMEQQVGVIFNYQGKYATIFVSWKFKPIIFMFVVSTPCLSSPSLTILVPLWLIAFSSVFFYLSLQLFSGFLQFNVQNNLQCVKFCEWGAVSKSFYPQRNTSK